MKRTVIFILFPGLREITTAQYHNAVYMEAGGAGLLETVNFDSRTQKTESLRNGAVGWRIGAGISPYSKDPVTAHTSSVKGITSVFLIGVNTFFDPEYSRETGHNIELGANIAFAQKNSIAEKSGKYKGINRIIPSLNFGFRKQLEGEQGFLLRACYSPYFPDNRIRYLI